MRSFRSLLWSVLLLVILHVPLAMGERADSYGVYAIHYNALTTDLIEPSVARAYGIIRSKNRALVNVAVLKKVMGTAGQPVTANVKVTATNLNSQLRNIKMRELNESGAIYYIGEFPVNHEETLSFVLDVTPAGETASHTTTFEQQFITR